MYDHVYERLKDVNLTEKLDTPVAQDANGERCNNEDDVGCKVTHNLTHPKMCLAMDEVRGIQVKQAIITFGVSYKYMQKENCLKNI